MTCVAIADDEPTPSSRTRVNLARRPGRRTTATTITTLAPETDEVRYNGH